MSRAKKKQESRMQIAGAVAGTVAVTAEVAFATHSNLQVNIRNFFFHTPVMVQAI